MNYQTAFLLISIVLAATALAHPDEPARGVRWMWGDSRAATVTDYITRKQFVTEIEPSSCVVADSTLPPCRNVRQLKFVQPTKTVPIYRSVAPQGVPQQIPHPVNEGSVQPIRQQSVQSSEPETTAGSIWSWFRSPPLETVLNTVIVPTTVRRYDPNTVVTFSVRGCRPTRLPFDLSMCPDNVSASARGQDDGDNVDDDNIRRSGQHLDVHYALEDRRGKEAN